MSPAGRPPLSGERKHEVIQIRLTKSEKDSIDAGAAAAGSPTATWLRDLGLAAAAEIVATLPAKKTRRKSDEA